MNLSRSICGARMWRLRLLAAVLAVGGQLGISGASLTLARDESSAVSHTERGGIDLHRGHNEATCATCAALSIHTNVGSVAPPAPSATIAGQVLARTSVDFVAGALLLPSSCRAPPRES